MPVFRISPVPGLLSHELGKRCLSSDVLALLEPGAMYEKLKCELKEFCERGPQVSEPNAVAHLKTSRPFVVSFCRLVLKMPKETRNFVNCLLAGFHSPAHIVGFFTILNVFNLSFIFPQKLHKIIDLHSLNPNSGCSTMRLLPCIMQRRRETT